MPNSTTTSINLVSLVNAPEAYSDSYELTEAQLVAGAGGAILSADGGVITFDVMANDLGAVAKSLYSVDDGTMSSGVPLDLATKDADVTSTSDFTTRWETTASGNEIRIVNGKVEFRLTGADSEAPGVTNVRALDNGQVIHDSFVYAVRLGNGTLSWTTVSVTISGQDREATGSLSVSGAAQEGGTLTATLANVSDADGATTTSYQWEVKNGQNWEKITNIAGANTGTLSLPGDQSYVGREVRVVATTKDVFGGTTVFTGQGQVIANVNDAPAGTASASLAAGTEDTAYTVSASALLQGFSDEDGDTLSVANLATNHGTLVDNGDGTYTITPPPDFNGTVTLTYNVVDGNGGSVAGTRSYSVAEVNDAPTAGTVAPQTVAEDGQIAAINVLAAASKGPANESGQSLTVVGASALHGTVSLNADGSLKYTANADYNGSDTISYTIQDNGSTNGSADPLQAAGTVAVTVTEVNDAPATGTVAPQTVAEDGQIAAINVLAAASKGPANESGQSLTVVGASALHGTVLVNPDGSLKYTANADYNGSDTISYTIQDNGSTNGSADPLQAAGTVAVTVTEVNDAPATGTVAPQTVAEDGQIAAINVLAAASKGPANESGQTLTVVTASALHGTVGVNPDGSLKYTANADYNGSDTISYTIQDNGTTNGSPDPLQATGTVAVTVTEVNDAPSAGAVAAQTVAEDGQIAAINVLAAASKGPANESGQSLTVVGASALHGTVSLNADGSLKYTANADYNGSDTISYTIQDNGSTNGSADPLQATGTVAVTVTEVNDAPTAGTVAPQTVAEDGQVAAINVLAAASSGPANESGQTLTVVGASALHGTVLVNPDGSLKYTANADYNGSDTISYTIQDNGTTNGSADPLQAAGTVAVTVTEVNDAPTAGTVAPQTVAEDGQVAAINVLAAASSGPANESGQSLTVVAASALHGTVDVNPDGSLKYTANADYNGSDTISYTIQDNGSTNGSADPLQATGTVAVTVTEVNDAPAAGTVAPQTVAEDGQIAAIDVLAAASSGPANESGQTLTVVGASALHGTVSLNADGSLKYTANADYNGSDTISYTIQDNGTTNGSADPLQAAGTVAVTVTEVNDAPTAGTVAPQTVAEDGQVAAINVLAAASKGPANESGQSLTVVGASALHGTVDVNPDGSLKYTANADYNGSDTISYTIQDNGSTNGSADPLQATGTVAVTVTEVNDAPTAGTVAPQTVAEDGQIAAIDVLPAASKGPANESGQSLTVVAASALHGTVSLNPDGSLKYTANADYNGSDTISYTIQDNGATNGSADPLQASGTVAVTVTEVNDAPTAGTVAPQTVAEDGQIAAINVLAAAFTGPANESGQSLTVVGASALHGTVDVNPDGSLKYTANADYNGSDTISYTIQDNGSTNGSADPLQATGTVAVTVTEVNDAPTAGTVAPQTVAEDGQIAAIDVLPAASKGPANESGQSLTVVGASALHGTVLVNPDGSLKYTANADYNGSDTISYTIQDNGSTNGSADPLQASGTVAVTVTEVNDAPTAGTVAPQTVAEDGQIAAINVLAAAFTGPANESGQSLTVVGASALHGTVDVNPDGSLKYTANADYNGSDTISYTIQDNGSTNGSADPLQATGTVAVTVTEVNDAPAAGTVAPQTVAEDGQIAAINVLAAASKGPANESGQSLTVVGASALHGAVEVNPDGSLKYTAYADYNGSDTISYTIQDNGTSNGSADPLQAAGTVAVTVTEVNDAPTGSANAVLPAGTEDTPYTVSKATLLQGFTDVDTATNGQVLSVTGLTVSNGSVVDNGATFTITPTANFNGAVTLSYSVTDGHGGSVAGQQSYTLAAVNDAPQAGNDSYSTNEDVALTIAASGVLANDTDVENDALTAQLVAGPTHGSLSLNANGGFTYTPDANYFGADSFTYTASDGAANSAPATVTLTVNAVNDAPVTAADTLVISSGTVAIPIAWLLGNDVDPEGGALSLSGLPSGITVNGSNLVINTAQLANKTSITVGPSGNTQAFDTYTIGYDVKDPQGLATSSQLKLAVVPVNATNGADTIRLTAEQLKHPFFGGTATTAGSYDHSYVDVGGGADSVNATGASNTDTFIGGAGQDQLLGGGGNDFLAGGANADTLRGDAGADTFFFDTALNAGPGQNNNVDRIEDFSSAEGDKIALSTAAGSPFVNATLMTAANFASFVQYDASTGNLSFDADGAGGASTPVVFATLVNKPAAVSFGDFLIS